MERNLNELVYRGKTYLCNLSNNSEVMESLNPVVFKAFYDFVTVEYSDGIKMDRDASKWASEGLHVLDTCNDFKLIFKCKK